MAYPTNPIYKLIKDPFTNEVDSVKTKVGNDTRLIIGFSYITET